MSSNFVAGLDKEGQVVEKPRLQLADGVRTIEQIAKSDSRCRLWEKGIVSFTGASQTERVIDHQQASRSQFRWRSKDSLKR